MLQLQVCHSIDLTRMECKVEIHRITIKQKKRIDLTRMECKAMQSPFLVSHAPFV